MEIKVNYLNIIAAFINFALLFAIGIAIFKAVKGFKNFIIRNKKMDKKLDDILNKLENKRDNWYLQLHNFHILGFYALTPEIFDDTPFVNLFQNRIGNYFIQIRWILIATEYVMS